MTETVRTVDDPMEGIAFGALPRIPVDSGFVAVEIGVVLIIVRGAGSNDDVVSHIGSDPTGVGIIRRTDPIERAIVAVLIVVDLLPIPRDASRERVVVRSRRLEEATGSVQSNDRCPDTSTQELQEESSIDAIT